MQAVAVLLALRAVVELELQAVVELLESQWLVI
jgi:hypothetical protein